MSMDSQGSEPSYDEYVASQETDNSPTETTEAAPAQEAQPQEQSEGFTGHPAWKPFEEALGPIGYRQALPHLQEMSKAAEAKIASTNEALKPWKQFIDEQVDPQELVFARQYLQEINTDPMAFYQKLHSYLVSTGQLEAAAQVAEEAAGAENEAPVDPDEDPRISELQRRLDQFEQIEQQRLQAAQQSFQEQQFQREVQSEEQKLEAGVQAIKQKGGSDLDVRKAIDIATLHYHRTGQPISLEDAFEQWQQERGSILNQPRPVDSAPRLPSVSGGAPTPRVPDLSTASRTESRDTLAALLQQSKG